MATRSEVKPDSEMQKLPRYTIPKIFRNQRRVGTSARQVLAMGAIACSHRPSLGLGGNVGKTDDAEHCRGRANCRTLQRQRFSARDQHLHQWTGRK